MSVMEQQPRVRRSFTDEFKRDAVGLVIEQKRTIVDVAGRLGLVTGRSGTGFDRHGSMPATRPA